MAESPNESETNSVSAAHGRGRSASWSLYLKRRHRVRQFLRSNLSSQYLQYHQHKAELLKKCSFYLEIEPKYVLTDENHSSSRVNILELIDPYRLQRVKVVGKQQTEIQLSLLTELLEHLEKGQEELSWYAETCDMVTFLSQWDLIVQKVGELYKSMETLHSLEMPGNLYVKHHLMSNMALRGAPLPSIRLSLYTKPPLIFDRRESYAHKRWAKLKWFDENQGSHDEQYNLYCKLLADGSQIQMGMGYGRLLYTTSNMCVVLDLQPGRSYKFTVRRSYTRTFVLAKWHDSIILKTKT